MEFFERLTTLEEAEQLIKEKQCGFFVYFTGKL